MVSFPEGNKEPAGGPERLRDKGYLSIRRMALGVTGAGKTGGLQEVEAGGWSTWGEPASHGLGSAAQCVETATIPEPAASRLLERSGRVCRTALPDSPVLPFLQTQKRDRGKCTVKWFSSPYTVYFFSLFTVVMLYSPA